MKITVCVKQVPDTNDIKWTENNTLKREGAESIINPYDEYAIETALRIKEKLGGEVTALSMGPQQAEIMLKEVIATGADRAYLLNDKFFAGSDTCATSRTLAYAIKSTLSDSDLIICGQQATDGDTAQTGPSLAQRLNLPVVSFVKEIEEINEEFAILKRETDYGYERIKVLLPAVICMLKNDGFELRIPTISQRVESWNNNPETLTAEMIGADSSKTGFRGSPTNVIGTFRPSGRINTEFYEDKSPDEAAVFLAERINEMRL